MRRQLGARPLAIHGARDCVHHEVVDPVLDEGRGVRCPEQSLVVGLVLAEQELRGPIGAEQPVAELVVAGPSRAELGLVVYDGERGLRSRVAPGPRVAEPECREEMQGGAIGTAVVCGHHHQDVVRRRLGVLDDDVEVPVIVEDASVQQLVFHVELAAPAVRGDEIPVGKRPLRILVLTLHIRVRWGTVEVEPVLLDVLAVVSLPVGEPEHPLLEDEVGAVPQRERQAEPLSLVADAGDAVLAPPVRARAGLVVVEIAPGFAVGAVVLAYRPPLPLAQVRPPRLPGGGTVPGLRQTRVLRGLSSRCDRHRGQCRARGSGLQRCAHPTLQGVRRCPAAASISCIDRGESCGDDFPVRRVSAPLTKTKAMGTLHAI
jgi:hypothetical protein